MPRATVLCLTLALFARPADVWCANQSRTLNAEDAGAWREVAKAIPLGTRVSVQRTGERRFRGTLMAVDADVVRIKRDTRIPEPAVEIPYGDLVRLERRDKESGLSLGKAVGIGLATGAGVMLTWFAIIVSVIDD